MSRRSLLLRQASTTGWIDIMRAGRAKQAAQFGAMDGWQRGDDRRFDDFVNEKRRVEDFERLDQRVERAYDTAVRKHTQEIWNACKKRLKDGGEKFNGDVAREVQRTIDERSAWLRDVYAQIDADYRSGDSRREERAAKEISDALGGDPGDYMQHVYEKKREDRFVGTIGKNATQAADDGNEMPKVSDEEANRYAALRMKMSVVEAVVKDRFGRAGIEHWEELQRAKDLEYQEKMDAAAVKYKELLGQQEKYDAAQRTQGLRTTIERMHKAQIRFKASMEMEEERLKLLEAHETMKTERANEARERRLEEMKQAAVLKAEGKPTQEIAAALKSETLQRHIQAHDRNVRQERETVLAKKADYLRLIEELQDDIERREGSTLMDQQRQRQLREEEVEEGGTTAPPSSLLASLERLQESTATLTAVPPASPAAPVAMAEGGMMLTPGARAMAEARRLALQRGDTSPNARKRALWETLNRDKWEDPFHVVHQARLDARATYSEITGGSSPVKYALLHNWHRGDGFQLAGGGNERGMIQNFEKHAYAQMWGMQPQDVFNLDTDGSREYIRGRFTGQPHVMDKNTMDKDLRFERRKGRGGVAFTGPRFYKLGSGDHGDTLRPVSDQLPKP